MWHLLKTLYIGNLYVINFIYIIIYGHIHTHITQKKKNGVSMELSDLDMPVFEY